MKRALSLDTSIHEPRDSLTIFDFDATLVEGRGSPPVLSHSGIPAAGRLLDGRETELFETAGPKRD